jgi:hypothetical protein
VTRERERESVALNTLKKTNKTGKKLCSYHKVQHLNWILQNLIKWDRQVPAGKTLRLWLIKLIKVGPAGARKIKIGILDDLVSQN